MPILSGTVQGQPSQPVSQHLACLVLQQRLAGFDEAPACYEVHGRHAFLIFMVKVFEAFRYELFNDVSLDVVPSSGGQRDVHTGIASHINRIGICVVSQKHFDQVDLIALTGDHQRRVSLFRTHVHVRTCIQQHFGDINHLPLAERNLVQRTGQHAVR